MKDMFSGCLEMKGMDNVIKLFSRQSSHNIDLIDEKRVYYDKDEFLDKETVYDFSGK